MLGLKLEKRHDLGSFRAQVVIPVLAVGIAFALTLPLVVAAGANPLRTFFYLVVSPFTTRISFLEIFVKTTPLLLTGISVAIAFKARFWNIGAEGQLYAGALAAAWAGVALGYLPSLLLLPLILLLGFLAGAAWALLAATLKTHLKVDEVVTTLLMNYIMVFFISAILDGPWRDPISNWPQSPEISGSAYLPILMPRSRLHVGILIALGVAALTQWFLKRTTLGFEIRTVGANITAARCAGVNVGRTLLITAFISGGIAGLAGVVEVCGVHYHLIEAISPGYGYTGIVTATLGGLHPWGVALAAFFLGTINIGGRTASRITGTPVFLADVIQGVLLLSTLTTLLLANYRLRRIEE